MLKIFNSLTKKKETFLPKYKNVVNIYVCGVTVSDICHIGHARVFIFFDVLIRYLNQLGYKVNYIRNITDIDDKIIKNSKFNKENVFSFSKRMIIEMKKDFINLNLLKPKKEPKVTNHIHEIIKIIKSLIENKFAYIHNNGDVLFSINNYKKYGSLSRSYFIKNKSNLKKENISFKEKCIDFCLWKKIKKKENINEIFWNSPWGPGRPGWHIECSAIIEKYFNDRIDIHGGGIDLLFPHHENELAQSVCYNKNIKPKYWMHVGMLIINNEKMSKTFKNSISIKEILKKYNHEVLRFFLLSCHYRHPLNFCYKNIELSKKNLNKMYLTIINRKIKKYSVENFIFKEKIPLVNEFFNAINNDINVPQACYILKKISKKINYYTSINKNSLSDLFASILIYLGNLLGLFYNDPKFFLYNHNLITVDEKIFIKKAIILREYYRNVKKWDIADNIRKMLLFRGFIIQDTYSGTLYKKNV